MADKDTIELRAEELEMPVKATLGYLTKDIRFERGFYEAKVAALHPPKWAQKLDKNTKYLLGTEKDEDGRAIANGAWIRFGDRADDVVSRWQPRTGDRVIVFTLGEYDFDSAWLYRLATSYDTDAAVASDLEQNGPASIFSGRGSIF